MLLLSQFTYACELTARINSFPPKKFVDSEGNLAGLEVEIIRAVEQQSGHCINLIEAPWGRSIELLKSGQLDLILNFSHSKEREKFTHYIGPYGLEVMALMVNDYVKFPMENLEDLQHFKGHIGREKNSWQGNTFAHLFETNKKFKERFVEVTSHPQKLAMLKAGRISGAIVQRINASHLIKTSNEYKDFKLLPFDINTTEVYIGASKKTVNSAMAAHLQKTVETLKTNGVLDNIWRKYNLP